MFHLLVHLFMIKARQGWRLVKGESLPSVGFLKSWQTSIALAICDRRGLHRSPHGSTGGLEARVEPALLGGEVVVEVSYIKTGPGLGGSRSGNKRHKAKCPPILRPIPDNRQYWRCRPPAAQTLLGGITSMAHPTF